jgi:hypothetical protein
MRLSCDTGLDEVESGVVHGSCGACKDDVQTAIAITKATRPIARRYVQASPARHRQSAGPVVQFGIARSSSILHYHRLYNYQFAAFLAASNGTPEAVNTRIRDATIDRKGGRCVARPYTFLVAANE